MNNTSLFYTYRDASNFKQHKEIVLQGSFTPEDVTLIAAKLNDEEYFIPNQVGLEDLQKHFAAVSDDDHPWHELRLEDIQHTNEVETEEMTWAELVQNFATVTWDATVGEYA